MPGALHEVTAVVATIDPQTINNTSATSDWVNAGDFDELCFLLSVGATDTTVDAKLREATDSSGSNAADISGKSITQLSATDDNKQAVLHVRADELSPTKPYVACVVTVGSGSSGAVISVVGLGGRARYEPASDSDLASVVEIVS